MTKKHFVLLCMLSVAIVLLAVIASVLWMRSADSRVYAVAELLDYDATIRAVDRLYEETQSSGSGGVTGYPDLPVPPELAKVNPTGMRLTDEGVYLQINRRFVEENGIFILKRDSPFTPSEGTDPSYRQIRERLYVYHVSG